MDPRVIICVGVGERYEAYARRLHRSVDAYWDGPVLFYEGRYPEGSPTHEQLHYAFKIAAMKEAVRRGHRRLLYVDACVLARSAIAPLFDHIEKEGYVLIEDSHKIRLWTGDALLAWAGLRREEIPETQTSAAGGFVGMNLDHPAGRLLYERWCDAVERRLTHVHWKSDRPEHTFKSISIHGAAHISDDPSVLGSLGDESVLGLIAFQHGLKRQPGNNPWCSQMWNGVFQSTGYDGVFDVVDKHTVIPELLSPGGWVLDVGARGYVFAREMARRGHRVVAIDPEPPPAGLAIQGVALVEAALVGTGKSGRYPFGSWDNGECDHLAVPSLPPIPGRASVREVAAVDIQALMSHFGIDRWDCVKMNCEGSEFEILGTWPGPIAKQLSISFHDHTGANPGGQATHDRLLGHLEQWYAAVRHVWEERYSAGPSYWDSVFVLRDRFR